jgi:hypothetical protein
MLDGVDNSSYATAHQGYSSEVVSPPPDAIQEFKLQTVLLQIGGGDREPVRLAG